MVKIDVHNDKQYGGKDEWCITITDLGVNIFHGHFDEKPVIVHPDLMPPEEKPRKICPIYKAAVVQGHLADSSLADSVKDMFTLNNFNPANYDILFCDGEQCQWWERCKPQDTMKKLVYLTGLHAEVKGMTGEEFMDAMTVAIQGLEKHKHE